MIMMSVLYSTMPRAFFGALAISTITALRGAAMAASSRFQPIRLRYLGFGRKHPGGGFQAWLTSNRIGKTGGEWLRAVKWVFGGTGSVGSSPQRWRAWPFLRQRRCGRRI